MPKEPEKQKLKRLLANHLRAQIALSWIGAEQDEDERIKIQRAAAKAENDLDKYVEEIFG